MVVNYSKTDLDALKYQLDSLYALLTGKAAKSVLYKTIQPQINILKELFMYKFVLDDYIINNNTPDPNNFITPEEFTCITQRIKELAC